MATLKNTTISGTNGLTIPRGTTGDRPGNNAKYLTTATFTSTGSSTWTCPTGVTEIELLIVGGGGAGSRAHTTNTCGGGGAGGLIYKPNLEVSPGTSYTVTVGAGGTGTNPGGNALGGDGGDSSFVGGGINLVGDGGGRGAGNQPAYPTTNANAGGSGGGGGSYDGINGTSRPYLGNTATQPGSTSGGFGHAGGNVGHTDGFYTGGGGGGGAGGPGKDGIRGQVGGTNGVGGSGGPGLFFPQFTDYGENGWFAGGGGGSGWQHSRPGAGGLGGGARGGSNSGYPFGDVTAVTANTGGGGGGAKYNTPGNTGGGSGIVIIRYRNPSVDLEAPEGSIRYNTDFKDIEIYNKRYGWTAQDTQKNYAGHNTLLDSSTIGQTGVSKYAASDTLSTNNAEGPDGNTSATLFRGDGSTSTRHFLGFLPDSRYYHDSNSKYTFSIFAKARGASRYCTLETRSYSTYSNPGEAVFDLTTGELTSTTIGGLNPRIIDYGNGWYRLSITAHTNGGGSGSGFYFNACNNDTGNKNSIVLGTADGYYLWGMQDEKGTTPTDYTPITDTPTPPPYEYENWRIHKFTTTGTAKFVPATTGIVEVLVIGGGGAGGNCQGNGGTPAGGGGAGGLIYKTDYQVTAGKECIVTVGAGGAQTSTAFLEGEYGEYSRFDALVALGGGGGGSDDSAPNSSFSYGIDRQNRRRGRPGGSGGGASRDSWGGVSVIGQGFDGGGSWGNADVSGPSRASHCNGGGGAGSKGGNGNNGSGDGGNGRLITITGEDLYYAGGGAGGGYSGVSPGKGGLGGGGDGAAYTGANGAHADAGTANTGGGGGGGAANGGATSYGGAGGSGIVVVRYKVA